MNKKGLSLNGGVLTSVRVSEDYYQVHPQNKSNIMEIETTKSLIGNKIRHSFKLAKRWKVVVVSNTTENCSNKAHVVLWMHDQFQSCDNGNCL